MEPAEYETLFAHEESFWWYRGLRRLVMERVAEILGRRDTPLPREAPPRILDAGCGTGGMLARLKEEGSAYGLDVSPRALALASRRAPVPLCRGSVGALPFRSGSFAVIVSLDVLYHRMVESEQTALREFRRCLAPGGMLVLNLPAYEGLRSAHDEAIHTARRFRRGALRRLLGQAGLEPVRVTYWNTLLFPGLALIRLLRRPRAARRGRSAGAAGRAQSAGGVGQARSTGGPGNARGTGRSPRSEVAALPSPLNRALEQVLALERRWLRRRDLPYGLSLLALARRPKESGPEAAS